MGRTREHRRWLLGVLVTGLIALVVFAVSSSKPSKTEIPPLTPALFDHATGTCVGDEPVSLRECEEVLKLLQSTLMNAATAQESHLVSTGSNEYTKRISELRQEGLVIDPSVEVTILEAGSEYYCIGARTQLLGGATLRIDSEGRQPSPAQCR